MNSHEDACINDTTIVIPTYNRPHDLLRLLTFLQVLKNPYPVFVLDSSKPQVQKMNQALCNAMSITYRSFPDDTHFGLKIKACLNENIISKYIIFCGDDDFVIPESIKKCADFLESHPDYSAVTGVVKCLAYPKKCSTWGFFAFIDHLKNPLILQENTFLARYLKLSATYQTGCPPLFYALRRTLQVREIFNKTPGTFKYSSLELINNTLTLVWGKSLTLPHLLLIRNYSTPATRDIQRENKDHYFSPEDVKHIREVLTEELKKTNSGLSDEVIEYSLDQFIKLPLENVGERYKMPVLQTKLAMQLHFKKNWLFYILNYIFPSLNEKFDVTLNKKFMLALRKAFSSKLTHSKSI